MPKAEADSLSRRSLHERIAADLRDEIMSGDRPLAPIWEEYVVIGP